VSPTRRQGKPSGDAFEFMWKTAHGKRHNVGDFHRVRHGV
jgi:hypothetical protein